MEIFPTAFFRCLACFHTLTVEIDRGQIAEPDKCPREVCGLQGSMSLIHNRCEFADRQVVRLQETPGSLFLIPLSLLVVANGHSILEQMLFRMVKLLILFHYVYTMN